MGAAGSESMERIGGEKKIEFFVVIWTERQNLFFVFLDNETELSKFLLTVSYVMWAQLLIQIWKGSELEKKTRFFQI